MGVFSKISKGLQKTRLSMAGAIDNMLYGVNEITDEMFEKITQNHEVDEAEARETAKVVGLSAIKYGDLSNQASKNRPVRYELHPIC